MKSKWIRTIVLVALLLVLASVGRGVVGAGQADIVAQTTPQPTLWLPFGCGEGWYYTNGPHRPPTNPAIDFAPPGCTCNVCSKKVVAAADGKVVLKSDYEVVLDHDMDGNINTGWATQYYHLRDVQVNLGDTVHAGDFLGYPGCAGGTGSGAHLHFGFEYNGVWTSAVGKVLSGWQINSDGSMTKDGQQTRYPGVNSSGYMVSDNCSNDPPDTSIISGPSGTIGTSSATFTWAGTDDQTPPANLQYSYRLDSYSDWSGWTGNTSVTYNNLPDRSYTFRVKARDQSGIEDPFPAERSFSVDTSPPNLPTISISGPGCAGIQNNGWQNTCYDPAFTWTTTDVGGSGIQGYYYCWSTDPNCNPDTWITGTSFDPGAIAPLGGTATYYLNVRARDNQNHDSSISSFGVLYDGTLPTVSFQINGGADTTNQANVLLNLSANDTGSQVSDVRISNNNIIWLDWQPYADSLPWTLPALDRHTHTVYVQVRDHAGNVSAVTSDTIYLDLYPPMPHSENYRICQDVLDAGGSVDLASTSYALVSAIGQPWATGADANTSSRFTERAGFLSGDTGCLPISYTITSNYTITQWVVASAGNLRGSTSYRLGDTTGQPAASGGNAFASASYLMSSGFWAQITGTVPSTSTPPTPVPTITPTITPTPTPTPTPQPGSFGLSINGGDLYTNDPLVTVRAWAPNVTHLRLSNDSGYADEGWWTYQITNTWLISTEGDYVTPRTVYAWFRDEQGDVYGAYFDDIIYDPVSPEGWVSILGGEAVTVTLWLEAWDDNSGVAEMRVGESSTLEGAHWQPYANTMEWVLTGDVAYAQFRDNAGNLSPIYSTEGSPPPHPSDVYLPVILRQYP